MTEEEATEKAAALLDLLESDFGQSGRDVRLLAIRDELLGAACVNADLLDALKAIVNDDMSDIRKSLYEKALRAIAKAEGHATDQTS